MGSENASMATKCIDQMPTPSAAAPPMRQTCRNRGDASTKMRPVRSSAVYDASVATTNDIATSQGLYELCM